MIGKKHLSLSIHTPIYVIILSFIYLILFYLTIFTSVGKKFSCLLFLLYQYNQISLIMHITNNNVYYILDNTQMQINIDTICLKQYRYRLFLNETCCRRSFTYLDCGLNWKNLIKYNELFLY